MSVIVKDANGNNVTFKSTQDTGQERFHHLIDGDVEVVQPTHDDLNLNANLQVANSDVSAVNPVPVDTELGYAVNSVAGGTDTGVVLLAVRDDALGGLAEAEGDYVSLRVDADGSLYVTGISGSGGDASAANQLALQALIGEVQASPTANTVLDRLKTLATLLGGTLTVDASGSTLTINLPTGAATEAKQDDIITALGSVSTSANQTALQTLVGEVSATPTANTVLARLQDIDDNLTGGIDITDVVPGVGATNLGKAKDATIGGSDTGVAALAHLRYTAAHSTGNDGSYDLLDLTSWHELRTRDQRAKDIQNCNDYTDFTALNDDTSNLADSVNHVFGSGAVTFDKVNGTANTVYAAIQDTITALDISEIFEDGSFVGMSMLIPTITNVDYAFIRLGTDASNYNEWQWDVTDLVANQWMVLRHPTAQPDAHLGNGWDSTSITYLCIGVAFNAETDTLAGIIVDHIHFVGGRITDTTINASITSSVSTPNVNLHRIANNPTDVNTGNASTGTQRVVLATNQPTVPVSLSSLPALAAGTNNIGDVDVLTLPSLPAGTNNIGDVDIASALPAGTNNIGDVDVLTLPTLPAGDNNIGNVDLASAIPAGTNNIGDVDVASVAIPSSLSYGNTNVTTAGTEVALASSTALTSGVTVKAKASNTGLIYVGLNGVSSSTGFQLAAGEQIFIEIDNLATVYVDSAVNGEGVTYIGS